MRPFCATWKTSGDIGKRGRDARILLAVVTKTIPGPFYKRSRRGNACTRDDCQLQNRAESDVTTATLRSGGVECRNNK